MKTRKNKLFYWLICCLLSYPVFPAFGGPYTLIEIPSIFDPLGSGARAIGRGGAFIGVADDATASSWNPGGLVLVKRKPEFSIVYTYMDRNECIEFKNYPDVKGGNSIFEQDINFMSGTVSFEQWNRNMAVSITYQHLYDFYREWRFMLSDRSDLESYEDQWHYRQDGRLSALGLSYCIQVTPVFSFGFTVNIWDDDISPNKWHQSYAIETQGFLDPYGLPEPYVETIHKTETYEFKGINANLGMMWIVNKQLHVGAVLKTPFQADIRHKIVTYRNTEYPLFPDDNYEGTTVDSRDESMNMPLSFGIGCSYQVNSNLSVSADIYRTEWDDFSYEDSLGNKICPITRMPYDASDVDPTYQVRMGGEYLFKNVVNETVIPIRWGLFYVPSPAENNPDDYYGLSLGLGFTQNNVFSFDMAYQFRYGNNVSEYLFKEVNFTQDVKEHMLYASMIIYQF
jgi:long-subunit fatty acid transport protein